MFNHSLAPRMMRPPGSPTTPGLGLSAPYIPPPPVDINLFLAGTYTGGARYIKDYTGTLVSVPTNVRAIEGGTWLDTVAEGAELGPDSVVNGGFTTDLSSWSIGIGITAVWTAGQARITTGGSIGGSTTFWFSYSIPSGTTAKRYKVTFDATHVSGTASLEAGLGYVASQTITPAANGGVKTSYSFEGVPTIAARVAFAGVAGSVWDIDNVTCEEVIPRFVAPVTAAGGYVSMPTTTNLLAQPFDFTNATWVKNAITLGLNATAAPDNTLTADKIIAAASTSVKFIYQNATAAVGPMTGSVFLKAAGYDWCYIFLSGAGISTYRTFNLTTGAVGTLGTAVIAAVEHPDGWWELSITGTATSATTLKLEVATVPTDSIAAYLGDGVSGLYLWGAQLTATAYPLPLVVGESTGTMLAIPTPSVLTAASGAIEMVVTPYGAGQTTWIMQCDLSGTAYTGIRSQAASITFNRRNDPSAPVVSFPYTQAAGVQFRVQVYWDSAVGSGVRVAATSSDISAVAFVGDAQKFLTALGSEMRIANWTSVSIYSGVVSRAIAYASKEAAGW